MIIKKIFHISDVHIRLNSRHDEYELVFKRLYDFINKNKDEHSVIFLGGDIVHNKIEVSPELIWQTANFLKNCADILPTILITGNHDLLINNPDRMDTLTPIVSALNHPNLHYWKNTGVYHFGGIYFSVFGCMDAPDKWVMAKDILPEKVCKIALHHGSVAGSLTDIEHEFESGVTLDHFDGFDLALLGDIHKFQFLNPQKTIGYSSSLLQQNYGESIENHGLIVWTLDWEHKNHYGIFHEILNDYAYFTLDIEDGRYVIPTNLPPNVRLRVRHNNTELSVVQRAIKEVSKLYKVISVTQQREYDKFTNPNSKHSLELGNSRDVEYQNKLIVEYLNMVDSTLNTESLKLVCDLNVQINKELPVQSNQRFTTWKPLKMEFANMFTYGDGNFIDFNNLKGVWGLFDTNISGKSSIFDILCFVLYDKTTRTIKASHIMNNTKNDFYVKLTFESQNKVYTIERIGTRKKDGNVKVDVNFSVILENGSIQILNGEDRDKTNYAIRALVGTYDDFVLTALSTQYDNQNFIEKSQKDRKELLYKFLDISVYDDLSKLAKERIRECQTLMKEYERENLHHKSSQIYAQIGVQRDIIEKLSIDAVAKKELLKTQMTALIDCNKNLQNIGNNLDIIRIEKNINSTNAQILQCEREITEIANKVEKLNDDIADKIVSISLESDNLANDNWTDMQGRELNGYITELQEINFRIKNINTELDTIKQLKVKLQNHKYDPNCKYCIANPFVKDATLKIEHEFTLQTELSNLLPRKADVSNQIGILKATQIKYEYYIQQKTELQDAQRLQTSYTETISKNEYKLNALKTTLQSFLTEKQQYLTNKETIENNKKLQENINKLQTEISIIERELSNLETQSKTAHITLERLKLEYDALNEKLDKYMEYVQQYRTYELYINAVGRDGVPYRILERILPLIEHEVNQILNSMVNFTVRLECNDDKYVLAYIVYDDLRTWPVEMTSGMERFVLSIAFRSCLTNITSLPKANFLTIDEGFGVLDSDNLLSIGNLFTYLRDQYDFMICVSHIEAMRDLVENHIKIQKNNNGLSKIII